MKNHNIGNHFKFCLKTRKLTKAIFYLILNKLLVPSYVLHTQIIGLLPIMDKLLIYDF